MNKLTLQAIALALLLAAFPLISYGTVNNSEALWVVGLASLTVGALLPVATRFLGRAEEANAPRKARDCGMDCDERVS